MGHTVRRIRRRLDGAPELGGVMKALLAARVRCRSRCRSGLLICRRAHPASAYDVRQTQIVTDNPGGLDPQRPPGRRALPRADRQHDDRRRQLQPGGERRQQHDPLASGHLRLQRDDGLGRPELPPDGRWDDLRGRPVTGRAERLSRWRVQAHQRRLEGQPRRGQPGRRLDRLRVQGPGIGRPRLHDAAGEQPALRRWCVHPRRRSTRSTTSPPSTR